jgi:FlaG/FlaF family flagellin (archaellin)
MTERPHHSADRGVTRVVGIALSLVLLLALTLLLAATAATLIVQDDSKQTNRPTATFVFQPTIHADGSDTLVVRHHSGDALHPKQTALVLVGANCTGDADPNGVYNLHEDFGFATDNWMGAGMGVGIDADSPGQLCQGGDLDLEGASVTVVWTSPNGGDVRIDGWGS